jgi:hypothetical protein
MATEREYLVSLGLAKEGRGRFSAEAKNALDKAKKSGMVFDKTAAEIAKEERASRPKRESKPKVSVPKKTQPITGSYDAKVVREWAENKNLIEKGKRGKLSNDVMEAYLKENSTLPPAPVKVPKATKKVVTVRRKAPITQRVRVRNETVGYTYARRSEKDPVFVSEPLVAVMTCGQCSKGVSYCGCTDGPRAPKYLGGEALLLTRPVK